MTESGLVLVFFDLETTGLNIETDEVIEVGAIKVRNNQIIGKLNTFVRPSCNIPQLVTNLTGITFEDVEKAPDVEDVKKRLKDFIGSYPLIAHNVSFDKAFLEKLLGEKLKNEFFDTLELSRFFFPSLTSHSLQNLVKTLSIEKDEAHRALSDAMMMYLLFQQIVSKLEETDPYLPQYKNYEVELADIVIVCMSKAREFGINLGEIIIAKTEYNQTRKEKEWKLKNLK